MWIKNNRRIVDDVINHVWISMTRWAINRITYSKSICNQVEDTRSKYEKWLERKRINQFSTRYDQDGNKL